MGYSREDTAGASETLVMRHCGGQKTQFAGLEVGRTVTFSSFMVSLVKYSPQFKCGNSTLLCYVRVWPSLVPNMTLTSNKQQWIVTHQS